MTKLVSPIYTGSQLLLPLAVKSGIPVDQLNYVICQLFGVLVGFAFRHFLPTDKVSARWRSVFCLAVGVAFVFFMIGWGIWQIVLQLTLCYAIMRTMPHHRHVGTAVFVTAMAQLLTAYVFRMATPLEHLCYDATYNLMLTTQKVTCLAYSLVDWRRVTTGKGQSVQDERKKWALKEVPSPLEFFSFMFTFQAALAGPFCHFSEFKVFIHGKDVRKDEDCLERLYYSDHPPSCLRTVLAKLLQTLMWIGVLLVGLRYVPSDSNLDPEFIASHNLLFRIIYLYASLFPHRSKYYVTWTLADAICNASGMGYTGLDSNGRHTWRGMSNVHVWNIETANNLKLYLDNWNTGTTSWLRHVCYMRAPVMPMALTFLLSAVWHGLYPGYVITFAGMGLCVSLGRKFRRTVRPWFQTSAARQMFYDVLTTLNLQLSMPLMMFPFVLLEMGPIVQFHSSMNWLFFLVIVFLHLVIPSKRSNRSEVTTSTPDLHPDVPDGNQNETKTQAMNGKAESQNGRQKS